MASVGFTALWLPPPSDSVSEQGYLPRDLYNLNSRYGSEGDLRDCISVLHENDLKVIADIVINHRCAHNQVCVQWLPDGLLLLLGVTARTSKTAMLLFCIRLGEQK